MLSFVTCFLGFVVANIARAAIVPPVFNPDLIVQDLSKCPVKNALFDKEDFDTENLLTMPDLLEKSNVTQKCKDAATNELISCFADGEPNSLQIMTGCCSKACADALQKSIKSGCFKQYVDAICDDPTTLKLRNGLFATGKRCANFNSTCEAPTAKAANATATAANSTTVNTTVSSRAAAAAPANATDAAGASKAADAATAPAGMTAKSGAPGAVALTVLSCMLTVVALVAAVQ